VDSDGENLERLVAAPAMVYSPTWSPNARRIAYAIRAASGHVELRERDLATGSDHVISAQPIISFTPAYSPDGKRLAFASSIESVTTEIHEYDVSQRCCLRRLTRGPRNNLSPSYSPDGRTIAFNSDRAGQLHVYVMPASGGDATLLSPYSFGEPGEYAAPEWSPTTGQIVFHGRSRGEFQIMISDIKNPGVAQQLTSSGRNEDPSWAPDGRHIVYSGVGSEGAGLYVIDVNTGRVRQLVAGSRLQMADWSPTIVSSAPVTTNGN
jgi:TolB protein